MSSPFPSLCDYELRTVIDGLRELLRPFVEPGTFLIYRDAFRWKTDDDHVLPNHYEMFSLHSLANEFGYDVVRDFSHVAIVRKK